jgi:signal transduction histidine kinase
MCGNRGRPNPAASQPTAMTPDHAQERPISSTADPASNGSAPVATGARGPTGPAEEVRARPWLSRGTSEIRRVLPVLIPVAAAGTAITVAAVSRFAASAPSGNMLVGAAALLIASTIAEAFPVPIEGVAVGRTSLATIFVVAAGAIYGWPTATIVAVLTMALVEIARRKPFSRVIYNISLYALAGSAAGAVAEQLAGKSIASLTLATLVASTAFYLVNITLLAAVVARWTGHNWLAFLRRFLASTAVPFGVMACLTVILVVLWDQSPFVAIVLAGPLGSIVLYEHRMHAALRRLRELDRLKDEFIAVVSHELRTPLASVYGAAMTLERRPLGREDSDSLLRVIYRESARLARLVDQVLWASRLDSSRTEVTLEPLDSVAIAQEVVDAARAHLPAGVSVALEPAAEQLQAIGDPEKVRQVLLNLVENAVKYSPDGGRINVRLTPDYDFVRFTVQDEGLGIPTAEQERIFEKFHRLDPNLTRGVGGTGLGLYICRELLHRMNGEIWVRSEVGKGSVFTFDLPRHNGSKL